MSEITANDNLMTVHEVSRLSGISIRTLHYYDEIGLLCAPVTTEAGYRLYDKDSLRRLQDILLFKELEFPLKDIQNLINRPACERGKILADQIRLLELKAEHLKDLIQYAKELQKKGDAIMSFKAFDKSEIEAYEKEAKEKWGSTEAFQEYESRKDPKNDPTEGMMAVFAGFGPLMDKTPDCKEAKEQVQKLKDYITANFYTCTDEILKGLGQMYVADPRFKENIDAAGGKGCAEFVSGAIENYCK